MEREKKTEPTNGSKIAPLISLLIIVLLYLERSCKLEQEIYQQFLRYPLATVRCVTVAILKGSVTFKRVHLVERCVTVTDILLVSQETFSHIRLIYIVYYVRVPFSHYTPWATAVVWDYVSHSTEINLNLNSMPSSIIQCNSNGAWLYIYYARY